MSAVPAALDALVALFRAEVADVKVLDGPQSKDAPGDVLVVGLAPQDGADVQSVKVPAGMDSSQETFVVLCFARSWSGSDDVKAQRDRTYRIVTAVEAALTEDATLGGAVALARFVGSTYAPWRTPQGQLVVDVPFRVEIRAFT